MGGGVLGSRRVRLAKAYLHCQVHKLLGDTLIGSFKVAHQVPSECGVFVGQKGVGHTLLPGTARTANAMGVCVDVSSHIVVHHSAD